MPRPRKPESLKQLQGTDQPCRRREEVLPDPVSAVPPAPDFLGPDGKAFWDEVAGFLHGARLLNAVNVHPLAVLCATYDRLAIAARKKDDLPGSVLGAFRNLCGEFGITPASASKIKPQDGKPANKFTQNLPPGVTPIRRA